MKKIIVFVCFLILGVFSVCAQTKRSEIVNSSAFAPINADRRIKDCRGNSVTRCGEEALMALDLLGLGGEDNFSEKKETFNLGRGNYVFLFSVLATKPSFTNEWRVRVAFTKTKTGFRFIQAGIQYRCRNGRTRGNWQKNECGSGTKNLPYDPRAKTLQNEVQNLDDFQFIAITGRGAGVLATPCTGILEICGNKLFNALYKPDSFEMIPARRIKRETFTYQKGRLTKGIYLVTTFGYEDDSVAGERIRIEFNKRGNSWLAQNGSKQYLCYRGGFANRWTKEFCP